MPVRKKTRSSKKSFQQDTPEVFSAENLEVKKWPIKKIAFIAFVILLIAGLLYYFKGLFIVSLVNGQPITRLVLIQELEKQGAKRTLQGLVTQTLIEQEAQKQNVSVADDEINKRIATIENDLKKQGRTLDEALSFQGLSKDDLKKQIRFQIMIDKMVGKEIAVTNKEVDEYYEKNKDSYSQETDVLGVKTDIKEQLKQQKLSQKYQDWLDNLQKNAKIVNLVQF